MKTLGTTTRLSVLAVSLSLSIPVYSQKLEEVVVTARKRAESIQDVPVAVSAIAGRDVENAFTLDTTSLAQFAPNVVMDTVEMGTPGGGGFSIRGISYQDVDKAFDPTVLVAVDEVPLATGTGQVFDMIDIERIEILRGPQGTLFGKNVVGGLINIHRTRPQLDETSGKVRGRYGQYEKGSLDFLLNYGRDAWAVKLTGGVERQDEGYIDNARGGTVWNRDSDRFGAHFLWAPSDIFTAEVQVNYDKLGGTPGALFLTDINEKDTFCGLTTIYDAIDAPGYGRGVFCSRDPGEPATGDRDETSLNSETWNELEKRQFMARMTMDVTEDHTLTYIGSWMDSDDDQYMDGDGTPYSIYAFRRWGDYEQVTNELRLSRDRGSPFTWQVGLFQSQTESTTNQETELTLLDPGCAFEGPCTYELGETSSDSYSIYGEADYAVLDERLVFTAGARYINETKRLAREVYSYALEEFQLGPNAGGSRTDSDTIYRLGARYHFNDDLMIYITTSTGFRSGGLSPRAQTTEVLASGYEPEELTNYEIGLKSTFFDSRMILNLTAFRMDYENMQIELAVPSIDAEGNPVGTGTQLSIENAGEAKVEGVEADFEILLAEWWRVSGNVGYLDAGYEELFVNIWGDQDASGNLLPPRDETTLGMRRAPEWSYSAQSNMTWEIAGGTLGWRLAYSWRDAYEATITNYYGTGIGAFGTLDSSITYERDQWRISLYGRNLTDEDSWTHSYVANPQRPTTSDPAPGSLWRFAQRRSPSEIGAELLYRF